MPQQFLDGANVIAIFQKVRGKGMPEGVTARRFADPGSSDRPLHLLLQPALVHMMPPVYFRHARVVATSRVKRDLSGGEHVLPGLFSCRVPIFPRQPIRQVDRAQSILQILLVLQLNLLQMPL